MACRFRPCGAWVPCYEAGNQYIAKRCSPGKSPRRPAVSGNVRLRDPGGTTESVKRLSPPIRFGVFEVDRQSGELRKLGVKVKLQDQPFQVLVMLLEHPGDVITREELQKKLWGPGTFVDFERGLNKAINRLRDALGDDADNPRFIETLPQRGYRFLGHVETASEPHFTPPALAPPDVSASVPTSIKRRGLFAIAGGLIAVPLLSVGYRLLRSPSRRIESIAVLPLENLSGDPAQEYFSDGMTDELIGQIAQIGSLRVISRTSVMRYKGGSRKPLPEIARELNVDAIVEGTVMQSGQRVRITAQLIRAYDDRHLWSEQYERDLTDVLALQGDVARAIASEIQIKLTPRDLSNPLRTRQVNPQAYEAFLRGNFFLNQGIRGIAKSVEFYREAIKIDPSQADVHASLAEALCYAGIFGFRPSAETYREARLAALKALEIDELSAGAHNVLAEVKKGYDWELAGAEAEYKRALQLNPNHLLTRLWYAECLARMGRYAEALMESERALAMDPVSPNSHGNRGMLLFRARRYDEAIGASQRALDLEPRFINALWWQGLSYAGNHDFPRSIAALTKARSIDDGPLFRALLGHVYGRAGDRGKALRSLEELTALNGRRYVSPVDFAVVYAGLGDADSTFQWMEKAYQARATRVCELPSMYFDGVRSDPRYRNLMQRIGLPL
ncbi:MAG: winged helix-turn-helix domain-containing protein [Acidobacteriota bacterium]